MTTRIEVLDHGYVELVETWGSDERIVEAARMSTGKGFKGWGPLHARDCATNNHHEGNVVGCDCARNAPGDEKLLRYLWEHKHATPFEMAGMIVEVQAPIFVFREWHRHRTQSYNEMSARYAPIPDVNYVPTIERMLLNAGGSNKQAGTVAGSDHLTEAAARDWLDAVQLAYSSFEELYRIGLGLGVPKELARIAMPVGRYSRMRASANLRNWLGFLTLRMDKAAQWEIRQYANAVCDLLVRHFPRTMELFGESMLDDAGKTGAYV